VTTIKSFDLTTPYTVQDHDFVGYYQLLPNRSAILTGMTTSGVIDFDSWESQINQLPQGYRFFIDNSYDPVKLDDASIYKLLELIRVYFPGSDPVFLSSKCSHYLTPVSGIVYFPFFFFHTFNGPSDAIRAKRIGCLNRHNSPHRVWLMHNLLSKNLIDSTRDIYSVGFVSPYDEVSYSDMASWLGQPADFNHILKQYPSRIATHHDGFPTDVSTVNHPAWHTAITVVTETEPGELTLITEKTLKAIVANCCWTSYMDESAYQLLEDFGFEPRFFDSHAQGTGIQPILDICQQLNNENTAADYRNSCLPQIAHNTQWFGNQLKNSNKKWTMHLQSSWFGQWFPKFQQSIS
jgi:hypothetical protein